MHDNVWIEVVKEVGPHELFEMSFNDGKKIFIWRTLAIHHGPAAVPVICLKGYLVLINLFFGLELLQCLFEVPRCLMFLYFQMGLTCNVGHQHALCQCFILPQNQCVA